MTSVIITLCLCSSFSASLGFGAFSRGVIPGTEPHYLKNLQAFKVVFDPIKPDIQEFKDKFMEPSSGRIKEGVTLNEKTLFVYEKIGEEQCTLIKKKWYKSDFSEPPSTVFSLSGNKEKSDIFYDYMNVTERDFIISRSMCELVRQ
jgi:hypothetical protein